MKALLLAASMAVINTANIAGVPRVIDGDTIAIGSIHIRLKGIDAPELDHPLGERSREMMQSIVGRRTVFCYPDGSMTHGRIVATCISEGRDIGQMLIRQGLALDCRHFSHGRYADDETRTGRLLLRRAPYC